MLTGAAVLIAGAGFVVSPAVQAGTANAASAATASAQSNPAPASSLCPDANLPSFGPNVCVFSDSMSQSAIQADLNAIATQQVPVASQFDSQRYAIFFKPGTYGSPADSNLTLNVDLPSSPPAYAPPALDAFGAGCANSAEMWSASQAAPIRRAIINGSVVFQDYCANNNFASGGFIADSEISGDLNFNGNQQYTVRNSDIGGANGCPNGLWNMVYSGVQGAPAPVFTGQCQQNTVLDTSPVTEEEPFLYTDSSGGYQVFLPAVQHDTSGPSWASGSEAGTSLALAAFFVASPATPVGVINAALAHRKDLILTPGVYNLDQPIVVSHPDTVVLGLGFATLVPQDGNSALIAVSNDGVRLSGIIVDAGPVNSPVLVSVGHPGSDHGSAADPDTIQDVFFRIGGAETTAVSATVSLLDNAGNSIIDDVWARRADHGNNVGWTQNVAATGLVVTAYGLAVEHYQKDEVVWSGQGGTEVFLQNELPYDPPSQSDWMATPTQDGYPALLVSGNVTSFQGYGLGSYVVFTQTSATLFNAEAFQSPDTPGVQFHNVFAVWIGGSGGDDSVINGVGGPATSTNPGTVEPVDVTSYP